jgi:hypothetical protein
LREETSSESLKQKSKQLPDLEAVRDLILKKTRSDKLKAVETALNQMITEVQNERTD